MNADGGSLRRRVSLALIGITSVIVAVNGIATWMTFHALLIQGIDHELGGFAKRLQSDQGAHLPRRMWSGPPPAPGKPEGRGDGHLLLEVTDAKGRVLFRSSALDEQQSLAGIIEDATPTTGTLADGRTIRGLVLTFATIGPERRRPMPVGSIAPPEPTLPLTARVGFDLTRQTDELRQNAGVLAAMWLVATALAWAADILVRSTILRPLHRLSTAIDLLGPNDLAARLPADSGPAELRGIVSKLNSLLDRLHQAFTREQATIANIAHELRTPVAALRTDLEFRLLVATDPAERKVLSACMGTITNMQNQVANLLLLARLEAGREALDRAEVELVDLIADRVGGRLAGLGGTRREIICTLPEHLVLTTSRAHLSLLLDNLLGNARAHGVSEQPIRVGLHQDLKGDRQGIRLMIANPYVGNLDQAELGKPYYRSDDARHDGAHSGLGLALCLRLSCLLGGSLEFATANQVFSVTLHLPSAPGAPGAT